MLSGWSWLGILEPGQVVHRQRDQSVGGGGTAPCDVRVGLCSSAMPATEDLRRHGSVHRRDCLLHRLHDHHLPRDRGAPTSTSRSVVGLPCSVMSPRPRRVSECRRHIPEAAHKCKYCASEPVGGRAENSVSAALSAASASRSAPARRRPRRWPRRPAARRAPPGHWSRSEPSASPRPSTTIASVATTLRVGLRTVRLDAASDVDDITRSHQVHQCAVRRMHRHDPGVGPGGRLGQPAAQQPDVGEHFAAPRRARPASSRRPRRRPIASHRELLGPNGFRGEGRRRSARRRG